MQMFGVSSARPRKTFGDQRVAVYAMLFLTLLICVTLDTIHLGRASLWSDEVFSRYYYQVFGPGFVFSEGLRVEPTPPTYYVLLQWWMRLFGDSEAALRSLSVACNVAALPLVFLLSRQLTGRREALVAALLFALSPIGLNFAQEARVYAMTLPPAALVLLAVAAYLRNPRSRTAAVAYVFGATLCLYLHVTLLLMVASCALVVTLMLMARRSVAGRSAVLRWMMLNAIVLVLALPYLVHVVGASQSGGLDWIGPLKLRDVVSSVAVVTDGLLTPFPWPSAFIATTLLSVLAASLLVHRPTADTAAVLVFIPGVFLAELILVSLVRPILLPRVLCWTSIPLCVLIGRQLLCAGRLRFVLAVAVVAAFGTGLVAQETARNANKEPWREMFAQLGSQLSQADLVVLSPRFNPLVVKYYDPGIMRSARLWDERLRPSIMTVAAQRMLIAGIDRKQISDGSAAGKVIWVLSNSVDAPYLELLNRLVPAAQTLTWDCGAAPCIEAEKLVTTGRADASLPPAERRGIPPT